MMNRRQLPKGKCRKHCYSVQLQRPLPVGSVWAPITPPSERTGRTAAHVRPRADGKHAEIQRSLRDGKHAEIHGSARSASMARLNSRNTGVSAEMHLLRWPEVHAHRRRPMAGAGGFARSRTAGCSVVTLTPGMRTWLGLGRNAATTALGGSGKEASRPDPEDDST
jgi:hypothetical protein